MMAPTRLLLVAACAMLAFSALTPCARAHSPVATKALLAKSSLTLKGEPEAIAFQTGSSVGDRLVVQFMAGIDGHGQFPRHHVCTVMFQHPDKGLAHQCTTETFFSTGTILTQGTIYLLGGVWTGNTAVVGGTMSFKTLNGEERLVYDPNVGTGLVKYTFK